MYPCRVDGVPNSTLHRLKEGVPPGMWQGVARLSDGANTTDAGPEDLPFPKHRAPVA
jgi:hypothetical protein